MPIGIPNKRHSGEYKQQVGEYKLSCGETAKIFDTDHQNVAPWERIYLTYGADGSYPERRGRGGKGKLSKPPKQMEEDLIIENQKLRAENDYLKNLHALVAERIRRENGHR